MWRVALIALVACNTSKDPDDFPVDPGGGNGGGNIRIDASTIDAFDPDGNTQITGRVCLVTDLRVLTPCANTGAGNITVTLGGRTATTNDDGTFAIATPTASNIVWRASGAAIVSSVMAFGPSKTIPAIGVEDYNELQNANSVVLTPGQGSIIARIARNNAVVMGATAEPSPDAQFATMYDGPTPTAWTQLATGTAGTVWIAGASAGITNVTATPPSGAPATSSVLVEDQAITYVTIDLP